MDTKTKSKFSTYSIVMMALFAAILCVSAYISIPLPNGTHITLLNFVITLIALVFPLAESFFIGLIWMLLGLVGVPVFVGGQAGPGQRKLLRKLQAKAKRHGSMPDPSNRIAKADIEEVLDRLAVDSTMLVYCNFNILVSCPPDKVTPVTSFLETKLYECGIMPSRTAYNQLELFMDSFPGNGYAFNPDYDLFLTLSDAALCFFFKEHLKESEDTPLTTYYTDRQGLPVFIDITGKEGKKKMTDNANFFCIGPSGSGKSFHMEFRRAKRRQTAAKIGVIIP
jgi:hypothetical protein